MILSVTGGAGLLGTAVLRRLLAEPEIAELRCLDLRPPMLPLGRLRYRRADVRDADLGRHLAGSDVVVHLAAVVTAYRPRAELDAINVGGTRNVFTAAAAAGVKQVIYTSSLAAFGLVPGHATPLVEGSPRVRDPRLAYAASKYDVEAWLDDFERLHPELAIVRLRPGVVVGERIENPLGTALRLGLMPDAGGIPMPSIWDEDVAEAVALAVARRARGAFNLAAGSPLPAPEIARAVGLRRLPLPRPVTRALGRLSLLLDRVGVTPRVDPAWLDVPLDCDLSASSERARRELGWTPLCATTVEVYRRYREVVPRRLDRRLAARFAVPRPAPAGATGDVHLAISGPRGGDVTLRVAGGALTAEVGQVPRPPSAVIRVHADSLLAILDGTFSAAEAQRAGRVVVEGDPAAAALLAALTSAAPAGHPGDAPLRRRRPLARVARWLW